MGLLTIGYDGVTVTPMRSEFPDKSFSSSDVPFGTDSAIYRAAKILVHSHNKTLSVGRKLFTNEVKQTKINEKKTELNTVYQYSDTSLPDYSIEVSSGSCTTSGTTLTNSSGTFQTDNVAVDDVVNIDGIGFFEVDSITSETVLVLKTAPKSDITEITVYEITRETTYDSNLLLSDQTKVLTSSDNEISIKINEIRGFTDDQVKSYKDNENHVLHATNMVVVENGTCTINDLVLTDNSADFITSGVLEDDIIKIDNNSAFVASVTDANNLKLKSFLSAGDYRVAHPITLDESKSALRKRDSENNEVVDLTINEAKNILINEKKQVLAEIKVHKIIDENLEVPSISESIALNSGVISEYPVESGTYLQLTDTEAIASLVIQSINSDGDVTYTAVNTGSSGNVVRVVHVDPESNSSLLSVSVNGNDITVNLGTDSSGNISSTSSNVATAVNGDGEASSLVSASQEEAGGGIVDVQSLTSLSGGDDGGDFINDNVQSDDIIYITDVGFYKVDSITDASNLILQSGPLSAITQNIPYKIRRSLFYNQFELKII